MELTGSAITALFVGLIWTLINVVKYFIAKYGKQRSIDAELIGEQAKTLDDISKGLAEIKEHGTLTKEQCAVINDTYDHIKRLHEMHAVYNDDHVPSWYVPKDLIELVRETHSRLNSLCKEIEENLDDVKQGQTVIVGNMSELITSQKLMTERLGDLISALNKISR
jgi:septation ring formation regulator EzrA